MASHRTYANVTKDSNSVQFVDQTSSENFQNMSVSSNVDEGYADQSALNASGSSSETQLKTVYTPEPRPTESHSVPVRPSGQINNQPTPTRTYQTQRRNSPAPANQNAENQRIISTPQPVPVRITNRNQLLGSANETTVEERDNPSSPNSLNTLVVGDSIFKGINRNGLKQGVRVCVKNGAKLKDIWDEISVYDLKLFKNIVVCVGGNDCSSRTEVNSFEEKYDELLGLIKAANSTCNIYMCKVVPRGDVDVTEVNLSIEQVAKDWRMHQVKIIESTNQLFFGPDSLPCALYFTEDGIHMSQSGTKRVIDAINRHVSIVHDFNLCVFHTGNQRRTENWDQRRNGTGNQRRDGIGDQRRRNGIGDQRRNGIGDQRRDGIGDQRRDGIGDQRRNGIGDQRRNGIGDQRRNGIGDQRRKGNRDVRHGPGLGQYHGGHKTPTSSGWNNRNGRSNEHRTSRRRICFGCSMPGHIVTECWYTQ